MPKAKSPDAPLFDPATGTVREVGLAVVPPAAMLGKAIYWQLSQAMRDFVAVGLAKTRVNTEQKFNFRGIDELMNLAAPILARHFIVILPVVRARTVSERLSRSNNVMFNVALEVDFTFVSALDGSSHTARFCGESTDTGDKATNKAMSAAFKYCLLQSFCIPLEGEGEDADAHTNEASVVTPPSDYAEFLLRVGVVAAGGTTALRAAWKDAKNGDVERWKHLVERDTQNWPLVKGKADDYDADVAAKVAAVQREGQ